MKVFGETVMLAKHILVYDLRHGLKVSGILQNRQMSKQQQPV